MSVSLVYCIETAKDTVALIYLTGYTELSAMWAHISDCSLRGPLTCATSIHWSPLCSIGVAQEADLVSPGFEQSRAISNHSTLDFTLHYGEQRIVLPGDASWKRLCSSSVPPDDDDDDDDDEIAHGFLRPPGVTQFQGELPHRGGVKYTSRGKKNLWFST